MVKTLILHIISFNFKIWGSNGETAQKQSKGKWSPLAKALLF